jgi:hypothetical protein
VADELRAAVIIDYQKVHLTGGLLEPFRPKHECLIHPLHYANQLIEARNKSQGKASRTVGARTGLSRTTSAEHDPKPYARNLAQKTE